MNTRPGSRSAADEHYSCGRGSNFNSTLTTTTSTTIHLVIILLCNFMELTRRPNHVPAQTTSNLGSLWRLEIGSTALKVVQRARLPVLLIRTRASEQARKEQAEGIS